MQDVVYENLQPLILGDQMPPLKTGKAYFKSKDQPRNPVTGDGVVEPQSIVQPDRPRMLKAAVEGVTVKDPHLRNPVTGDGITTAPRSIVDPAKLLRPTTATAFVSQFVITDDPGSGSDDDSKSCRRRPSDAQIRMFDQRNPILDCYKDDADADEPNQLTEHQQLLQQQLLQRQQRQLEKQQLIDELLCHGIVSKSRVINQSVYKRKRRVQPLRTEPQKRVLAWGKLNGDATDATCYIGEPPMIRRASARDFRKSPITGYAAAPTQRAADELVGGGEQAADDSDYYYDDDDDYEDVDECTAVTGRRSST